MDHHHKKEAAPLYPYPLDDSTSNRASTAATAFFAFLGEWVILAVTCSIALFFIPLTPAFTLQSTSASVLNVTGGNHFTANLNVELLVDDSNLLGSSIHYDSLHVSLFQNQEKLSTFSLPRSHEPTKSTATAIVQAKFLNVSVTVDEWRKNVMDRGTTSCGFVYLDVWFSANATYTQPMWPSMRDKLMGHCGELKVEMCSPGTSTSTTTVVVDDDSFLASCRVYSDVVHRVRLVLFVLLILFLVTAVAVPLIVEHFFCSSTSTLS